LNDIFTRLWVKSKKPMGPICKSRKKSLLRIK
jgi:hypothetical protein